MKAGLGDYEKTLVRRAWTKSERRAVVRALLCRMQIAIEPLLCVLVFGALAIGLVFFPPPAPAKLEQHDATLVLAPIFGLVAGGFLIYAVALMVPSLRALRRTLLPIYIVDGYVRYRRADRHTDAGSNGYVAVLNEERRTIVEWPSFGSTRLVDAVRPSLVEFSMDGGIHRIDGRSTGVVPETMPQRAGRL
jgi:hypothetical protein